VIVAINAKLAVTRKACIGFLLAQNLVDVFTALAITLVRSQLVLKIAAIVWLRSTM
jgi:hypothetical protein